LIFHFLGKICDTYEESIKKCFEENILPYLKTFDSVGFRLTKLYKESCDNALRKHLPTLKDIYKKAAEKEAIPGEDTVLTMSEFIDLIIHSGVVDSNFGTRDIGTLFNLSMMT
jgi:hypothetical protein